MIWAILSHLTRLFLTKVVPSPTTYLTMFTVTRIGPNYTEKRVVKSLVSGKYNALFAA